MAELSAEIHGEIERLCAVGDDLAAAEKYEEAISTYNKAWELVPDPKNDWNASTWILAAIGDAGFLGGYFTTARNAFEFAMHCPDAVGNPFLHLRLGQVYFEAEELDAAAEELIRAYAVGGQEIFDAEDSKYLTFLGTRAKL